jgi:hypothetical protein
VLTQSGTSSDSEAIRDFRAVLLEIIARVNGAIRRNCSHPRAVQVRRRPEAKARGKTFESPFYQQNVRLSAPMVDPRLLFALYLLYFFYSEKSTTAQRGQVRTQCLVQSRECSIGDASAQAAFAAITFWVRRIPSATSDVAALWSNLPWDVRG